MTSGLKSFSTDSDGQTVDNPRYLRKAEQKLKRLHRRVSRTRKRSNNRKKAIQRLAKAYLKVTRQRQDFARKTARALIMSSDMIAYDDLQIAHLVKNHRLAKSISDASWGLFLSWVRYYGRLADVPIVKVSPRFTTQDCSGCGERVYKSLSQRTHICPSCGLVLDRDHNAARNILLVAQTELAARNRTAGQAETGSRQCCERFWTDRLYGCVRKGTSQAGWLKEEFHSLKGIGSVIISGMGTSDTSLTSVVERIYLIGPSGSGKTTAAAEVAAMLGWTWVDTDSLVERASGRRIPAIFADEGEAGFRARENAALGETLLQRRTVIATGGGICGERDNVALMRRHGWLVSLAVTPETAYRRLALAAERDDIPTEVRTAAIATAIGEERPMLGGGQPLARLRLLSQRRSRDYLEADEIIVTDDLDSAAVAGRVVAGLVGRGLLPSGTQAASAAPRTIRVANLESYAAVVVWGGLATLGSRLAELGLSHRLHVIADATVARLYEPAVMSVLMSAGFEPLIYRIPAGEASKSREELGRIYDWLAERRAERNEALVALGGGVVGDLAGFAAASYQRGVPLVQVPTSLLAQVDSSIGGKVGINHPRGKNLIGAFYQPRLVLADPATLLTLPARQRTEGWAEVIKHGVVLDAGYFQTLAAEAESLLALEPEPLTRVVSHSVSLKASVIEGDERERDGGRRHLLNYGHTIGHAIEVVTGYGAWLHGEAVAVGMLVEARLGRRLGITAPDVVTRVEELLAQYGLPTRADGLSTSALLQACLWDKKVQDGHLRWALPTTLGQATLVTDVADSEVAAALGEVGAEDR